MTRKNAVGLLFLFLSCHALGAPVNASWLVDFKKAYQPVKTFSCDFEGDTRGRTLSASASREVNWDALPVQLRGQGARIGRGPSGGLWSRIMPIPAVPRRFRRNAPSIGMEKTSGPRACLRMEHSGSRYIP